MKKALEYREEEEESDPDFEPGVRGPTTPAKKSVKGKARPKTEQSKVAKMAYNNLKRWVAPHSPASEAECGQYGGTGRAGLGFVPLLS